MTLPRKSWIAVLCMLWMWAASQSALAQVRSIQEFMATKDRWNSYVGTDWRLEGRYSALGDRDMRFEYCDLEFRLPVDFVRTRWDSKVIEVRGKLEKQNDRFVFLIESLTPLLDDLDQLQRRRAALTSSDAAGWYALAGWARNRGTFYKDQKLLAAATEIDQQGLRAEFNNTSPTNEKALAALVDKAREKQASEAFLKEISHEQLWSRLKAIRVEPFLDVVYRDLALRVGLELPGALEALPSYPTELAETYRSQHRKTFQESDPTRRKVLARLLYLEVMSHRIQADFREDGSNGFEIAARLQADAPERTDLIDSARQRAVASRQDKVTVMSRTAVAEFSSQLRSIGRIPESQQVLREWLTAQETRLARDDARGRGDLAAAWLEMLADEAQAQRLYSEAWKINREYTPATEWLTAHHYKLLGDIWLPGSQVPLLPKSELDQAMESGRVLKGMTPAQVRIALGTQADSVTRMASSRRIIELWVYNSGYLIHFEREFNQKEARVESIEEFRPGSR